jgi:hypothetical protein
MRRLAAILVAAGLLTACAGGGRPEVSDQTLPGLRCSAEGMDFGTLDSDGIPSPVAARRQELIDAAVACDYRALGRLARADGVDLRFEGEVVPVQQWREREHDGIAILGPLAGLLALPHVRRGAGTEETFTWPTAVDWPTADAGTREERADLLAVVGERGIFGWTEAGGYVGWRTSIDPGGRWMNFWYGPVPGEYP